MIDMDDADSPSTTGLEVAIIGMACRFPGARNLREYWHNLENGVESISFFSAEELRESGIGPELFEDPGYVAAAGILPDVELFDAEFFGFSPREAEILDPQQRLFLECAWEALETAGYDPELHEGSIGVFAGAGTDNYLYGHLLSNPEVVAALGGFEIMLANQRDFLPTRVSYKLNLRGPSLNVQTACSTSLVAVHLAVQSLLNGECGMALAGGVTISLPQKSGYLYQAGMVRSSDGHCRAFDARAQGAVAGNGGGVVLLKRLQDALQDGDPIRAVVKGSAVNNDGALKAGFTAPSVEGQAAVVAEALELAQVGAETVGYVEAHGTATPLGDPIEVAALTRAFGETTDRKAFCALGSVKTNFGHLDAAAGIAGFIKTVLALEHRSLPPSLHFSAPNPEIDFDAGPFYVQRRLEPWPTNGLPRRAGVSSFGLGGTNAHVVVEEAPRRRASPSSRGAQLLVLSARSGEALEAASDRLAEHLETHPGLDLADVAYTLGRGRRGFSHRRMLVAADTASAAAVLRRRDPEQLYSAVGGGGASSVAFLFAGQGAQHTGMAGRLYHSEPEFRRVVDECCELLEPSLGVDLRTVLYPAAGNEAAAAECLGRTAFTQPALFVVEYALARLWMRWGVGPAAMIGHSVGEYTAAALAGVFSLADALEVVAERGRIMQTLPPGAMLAVLLGEDEVRPLLGDDLFLAAVNGPYLCVVSGTPAAVEALEKRLAGDSLAFRRLATSHAGHSRMMRPVVEPFAAMLGRVGLRPPRIPFLSSVSGTWITAAEATDPGYWATHLQHTVHFDRGVRELFRRPDQILLEVGPDRTLATLVAGHPDRPAEQPVVSTLLNPDDADEDSVSLPKAVGKLWSAGVPIDWEAFYAGENRCRVPLPTYPFERRRYWIERHPPTSAPPAGVSPSPAPPIPRKRPDVTKWFYRPTWKRVAPPGRSSKGGAPERVLVWMDALGVGEKVVQALRRAGTEVIPLEAGTEFGWHDGTLTLDPGRRRHYSVLFDELAGREALPDTVLHLGSLAPYLGRGPAARFAEAQDRGFYSLLWLVQALGELRSTVHRELIVVSNAMQAVRDGEIRDAAQATLLGPIRVTPQEYPYLGCRAIDMALAQPGPSDQDLDLCAAQLEAEILGGEPRQLVAYRGEERWVESFEALSLKTSSHGEDTAAPRLKERGVYLLTGGLGNIALALARHLAATVRARLVLVGRTPLPPPEQWPATAAQAPEGSRLRRVLELRELGAEILVLRADVTRHDDMRAALEEAEGRFGRLDGVVHAAGVLDPDIMKEIGRMGRAACETHFGPKVYGTLVLEEVLGDRELDFCYLLSSLSPILGGLGFVAYAAANAFLDAAAARHNVRRPGTRWTSVSYDGWHFVEPAATSRGPSLADLAIVPAEGVAAFAHLLNLVDLDHVVISTGDLAERRRLAALTTAPAAPAVPVASHPRPRLNNEYVPPRGPREAELAKVWSDVLGLRRIGVHDSFLDLGAHSLHAVRAAAKISAAVGREVTVAWLFSHPTIARLAEALDEIEDSRAADVPGPAPPEKPRPQADDEMPAADTTPWVRTETRALLPRLVAGTLPPVDAAAVGCLSPAFDSLGLDRETLVHDVCEELPVMHWILETSWGRIAALTLPVFDDKIYDDEQLLVRHILEAREMVGRVGARCMSLTGLIPSATRYGEAVAEAMGASRRPLPTITTGHATTIATVVLAIQGILSQVGRDPTRERVAFVGLGSVGAGCLRLMARALPHPRELLLCDVYDKRGDLLELERELVGELGFRGKVHVLSAAAELPEEVYESSLIVGATNVPDVLDVARLRPGTLIVDDSAPHCFVLDKALERLREEGDILFTEGGILRSPEPISRLLYEPPGIREAARALEEKTPYETHPHDITGCIFSSLLSSRFDLEPTVGTVTLEEALEHHRRLTRLGFRAADLHCLGHLLPQAAVRRFRERFGQQPAP